MLAKIDVFDVNVGMYSPGIEPNMVIASEARAPELSALCKLLTKQRSVGLVARDEIVSMWYKTEATILVREVDE